MRARSRRRQLDQISKGYTTTSYPRFISFDCVASRLSSKTSSAGNPSLGFLRDTLDHGYFRFFLADPGCFGFRSPEVPVWRGFWFCARLPLLRFGFSGFPNTGTALRGLFPGCDPGSDQVGRIHLFDPRVPRGSCLSNAVPVNCRAARPPQLTMLKSRGRG